MVVCDTTGDIMLCNIYHFAITMDDCGMFSIYGGGSDDILLAVLGWVSTAILDL